MSDKLVVEIARAIVADFCAWRTQYVGDKEPLRLLEAEIRSALSPARDEALEEAARLVESSHSFQIEYDGRPLVTPSDLAKAALEWISKSYASEIRALKGQPSPAQGVANNFAGLTPREFVNSILSACDPSNWDHAMNTGEYFKGLRDAYECIHEIAAEYQTAMYEWTKPAPAQGVPGWKLVPVEITEDMAAAMECEFNTEAQWSAALSAAPEPLTSAKR